jgi:ankyrin repeat protein
MKNIILVIFIAILCGCGSKASNSLCEASLNGNIEEVKKLVADGTSVNVKNQEGMSPLMAACKGGKYSVAIYLLAEGADIDASNDTGCVITWAMSSKNYMLLEYILNKGPNLYWKDVDGKNISAFATELKDAKITALIGKL